MAAFREADMRKIFHWIEVGESGSIIGVSNVGKSFLFQALLDPETGPAYLDGDPRKYIFLRINLHNLLDFKNRSVYSLILEQMELQGGISDPSAGDIPSRIGEYHEQMLSARDELTAQRFFKLAFRACLQDPNSRLVLLFDHFDPLYRYGQDSLFYNLRGLWDAYKNRIVYLVFTRHPLPDLPVESRATEQQTRPAIADLESDSLLEANSGLPAREELYELLQTNQLYLKPYDAEDADRMLANTAENNHQTLDPAVISHLHRLTGGHAGLLRICCLYVLQHGSEIFQGENAAVGSLTIQTIYEECVKIWQSQGSAERIALVARANHLPDPFIDRVMVNRLELKGMLTGEGKVFSLIFEEFVKIQKTSLDRPFYVDEKSQTVYVFNQPHDNLSRSEYLIFKILYDHENSVVSARELVQACWPNETVDRGGTPQSLTTMIYRIRQKLGISDIEELLQARHGHGYILLNRLKA